MAGGLPDGAGGAAAGLLLPVQHCCPGQAGSERGETGGQHQHVQGAGHYEGELLRRGGAAAEENESGQLYEKV